ncbi:helix-turn-helix transcriptional regulator [Chitinimonas arctica]|uniref:Helix-turn-helix transcriptional regulator n=1 Tax=Chitinimonas arctica TaxID=2594795 RepID=A0A516SB31_9NEIS|nr:helix-turn-helix transcriptional regulator [Chitinimonas arctica]QDQ25359.1 helix-turn-helix transcriptional regulator [Chitinimonas arctica]
MSELARRLTVEFEDRDYAHAYLEQFANMAIAAQIKALREQRGLTQAQLADLTGMKLAQISALEDVDYDAWTIRTLRKLAHAFDAHLAFSFKPFSKGILDVVNFSESRLEVQDRSEDMTSAAVRELRLSEKGASDEEQALDDLQALLSCRMSEVLRGDVVDRSITDVADQILASSGSARPGYMP